MERKRYAILLSSLFFMVAFLGIASASEPTPTPCYAVENPEHYKSLVYESEAYSYFQGWELMNITVPCSRGTRVNVVLEYNVPKSYSPNGLDYQAEVTFVFRDGQLTNSQELDSEFKDYKRHIEDFENEEATKFFIGATGATSVSNTQPQIFNLESNPRQYLNYNFTSKSIESFSFSDPRLINNLSLFVPGISNTPQYGEFERNVGVNFVEFRDGRLSIYKDFSCPTCASYLVYDVAQGFLTSYSLDNNFEWTTIPEVSKVHEIIKNVLLTGDLSNCAIGTGEAHSYTILSFHNSPSESWFLTVALKCGSDASLREATIRLNPDGTYDRLEIDKNYGPNGSVLSPGMAIIIIVIIVIAIVVFMALSRRLGRQKSLPKTK